MKLIIQTLSLSTYNACELSI